MTSKTLTSAVAFPIIVSILILTISIGWFNYHDLASRERIQMNGDDSKYFEASGGYAFYHVEPGEKNTVNIELVNSDSPRELKLDILHFSSIDDNEPIKQEVKELTLTEGDNELTFETGQKTNSIAIQPRNSLKQTTFWKKESFIFFTTEEFIQRLILGFLTPFFFYIPIIIIGYLAEYFARGYESFKTVLLNHRSQ